MAIRDGDIKLLQSKVMDDVPEGGGGPTGREVQWGKSNEVFEDITEVARAGGQVSIRQMHSAVQTNDTEPLLDANIIIDQPATDPNVSITLAACETFAKRSAIADAIANYMIAGVEAAWVLMGNHVKGQRNIALFHRPGVSPPTIRRTLVLVEKEGTVDEKREYVRVRRVTTEDRVFSYSTGGSVQDYRAQVTTCELDDPLKVAFTGSEPNRLFQRDTNASRVRDTTVADAMQFYGAAATTAAYTLGQGREMKVASIYTQLVPSSRSESISLDQRPAAMRSITLASSPRDVTVAVAPHTLRWVVGQENRGYSWTSILRPFPSPGTVVVSFMVLGSWYTAVDDGAGALTGDAIGTVNYTNGSISITLPQLPDVASIVLVQWGEKTGFTNRASSAAQARNPEYALQLPHQCIKPGSVRVSWTSGGSARTMVDSASSYSGALMGAGGTGLVNYANGQMLIRPTAWIDAGGEFLIEYEWANVKTKSLPAPTLDEAGFASITLDTVPAAGSVCLEWVTVRSVTASSGGGSAGSSARKSEASFAASYGNGHISQNTTGYTTTSQSQSKTQDIVQHRLVDDGAGNMGELGTINYGSKILIVKLADKSVRADSYQSEFMNAQAFEAQTRSIGIGAAPIAGGGGSNQGGTYSTAAVSEEVLAGNTLLVTYTEGFTSTYTASMSWAPPEAAIDLCPHTTDYVVPGSVQFSWLGHTYIDIDGDLIRDRTASSAGVLAGRIDYEGGIAFLDNYGTNSPSTPFALQSLWTTRKSWTTGSMFFRMPSAPVAVNGLTLNVSDAHGTVMTLTSDLDGMIDGDYARGRIDYQTGSTEIQFGSFVDASGIPVQERDEWWYNVDDIGAVQTNKIWRPHPVDPTTLRFNVVTYFYLPLDVSVIGMDPVRLPSDGRVPVFRDGNYVVVGHTGSLPKATLTSGQTIDCSRPRLSRAWIVDANGAKIQTGWSADLDAGLISISSVSGWVQPVQVFHRIEEMARLADVQINGTLTLTKTLSHNFPLGSVVSSALYVGTMRARTSVLFDQANWDGVTWQDSVSGNPATANYNDTAYPVEVTNAGALTERWVLRFKNTTEVEVIGEHVGNLGTFPIAADIAPINPNTRTDTYVGSPYFTVKAPGWGAGWATQNSLRINTIGAMQPFACIRTVQPSEAAGTNYSFGLLTRGDIDRQGN